MQVRPATPDDLGFIFETWVGSVKAASTHVEGLNGRQTVALLKNLLVGGYGWLLSVVEVEGRLIAWAAHGPHNRLGWIYVRDMHRGEGVCRWMLPQLGVDTKRPLITPFAVNRKGFQPASWRTHHRPFECVPLPL